MENLPPNRIPQINGYLQFPGNFAPKITFKAVRSNFLGEKFQPFKGKQFWGVSFHFSWCLINSDPYIIHLRFSKVNV